MYIVKWRCTFGPARCVAGLASLCKCQAPNLVKILKWFVICHVYLLIAKKSSNIACSYHVYLLISIKTLGVKLDLSYQLEEIDSDEDC